MELQPKTNTTDISEKLAHAHISHDFGSTCTCRDVEAATIVFFFLVSVDIESMTTRIRLKC